MLPFINFKPVSYERRFSESLLRLSLLKCLLIGLSLFLFATGTTFAQSVTSVSVSPLHSGLTVGQTLTFTATVTNDIGAAGVNWTVSAGGSLTGQTTSTVSFSSATAGVYTITATSIADFTQSESATVGVTDLAGVFTYHNDLSRDGSNQSEYALTISSVTASSFGKLFSCTVDGAIYTQPLWIANLTINNAKHNVVFVATQHESLYAFDADANPCVMLWQASLIDTNHGGTGAETSVPSGPTGNLVGEHFGDITPEVGITGTPVIDPSTNTLYVVSKSVIPSGPTFYQRLHAIDVLTGSERAGSPVTLAGTYPGTGEGTSTTTFNARQQNQRPALALVNGAVYIAWSSHEDFSPYYGWVMGYNAANLAQTAVLNVTPNVGGGGIWMGGGAPAADSSNNLYLLTGNAIFDANSLTAPNNDYGDSFLKLTSGLSVSQYFTPSNQASDNAGDQDFGSGGAAILVDQPSSPVPHLVIGGGKDGYLYVLNRDAMGGLGDSNAWQRFFFGNPIYATGAFWNGRYYLAGEGGRLQSYSIDAVTGKFNTSSVPLSPGTFGFPGSTPSVSSSGTANGIVWALNNGNYCTLQSTGCGPTVLHAYDATNIATELWNSTQGTANTAGNAVKFTVPTVANGKVYVGTRGNNIGGTTSSTTIPGELDVYGLLITAGSNLFPSILVNAGGPAYTDSLARLWSADTGFTGGSAAGTARSIANTPDPRLYQTERYGNSTYQFTVPNGGYNVTLKFAEFFFSSVGQRIFNVAINGTPVLTNFDIIAAAGATQTAIDKTFPVTVTNGKVTIQFITGLADLPKVSAIGISSAGGVFVQVNPTTASLNASQQQQFTASVTGNANTAVNWTYSPQVGTLTANGLYTAPASIITPQAVSVTATSQADTTKSAVATVNLLPSVVSVQVNPTTASLNASQQQQFTASVTGNANTAVNWTYSPQVGTLTANGLYTAPASIITPQAVSVTATSQADTTKSAVATVNLLPPAVSVQVSPTTASLSASQQQQFTASVTGNANTAVNWTYSPQVGTLTANGLYTAPASIITPQAVSVTATSQADTTKSAVATVSLLPSVVSVQVNPTTASLSASQQQQFTASVTGNANTAVNWTYSPQVGTLTANGLYTAPASIITPQAVSVTATSQADTTKSAVATVNLLPPAGSFTPILVNSGGAAYTDTLAQVWSADKNFSGGSTAGTARSIANTPDPRLYQTERYGNSTYQFTVPNGSYNVTLKFAEFFFSSVGQRIFNVAINGTPVLTNFDIIAAAGATQTAIDKTFPVTVTNGKVTIQFITGSADLPKISAIEIY